jgi:hypothetical protein
MTRSLQAPASGSLSILRGGESGCESVQTIINIAATAEAFVVTALGGALVSAAKGNL